jgi:2-polyprenyl-3-methyl-5-hydroxy-6-metoxy-1,4-benzoquinol methylase
MTSSGVHGEVASGQRFAFGNNWKQFLAVLNEERIVEAERSLTEMLGDGALAEKSLLDVGSGSGLFSLAAMRLGAARVHSFDYDPESVACTHELKRRYFPNAENWTIERGNALDSDYVQSLGQWDVVYSWGVLHHTGDMWRALRNVSALVTEGGLLYISIYNDQGYLSRGWKAVKKVYNSSVVGKWTTLGVFVPYFALREAVGDLVRRKNPLRGFRDQQGYRGMSRMYDWIDWLGGYPFEVARPDEVFGLYQTQGFALERLKTCGGKLGCNEFVLRKQ